MDREVHENLIDNNEDILNNVGRSASTLLMVDVTNCYRALHWGQRRLKKQTEMSVTLYISWYLLYDRNYIVRGRHINNISIFNRLGCVDL